MVYSDYTERQILIYSQNYKPMAIHKSNVCCAFICNVLFNTAALRALNWYWTIYPLKTRSRSFSHGRATVVVENDATV